MTMINSIYQQTYNAVQSDLRLKTLHNILNNLYSTTPKWIIRDGVATVYYSGKYKAIESTIQEMIIHRIKQITNHYEKI